MNKPCAKCSKMVYPTEKLDCLDKVWHKGCFRCSTCNMSLNMKNYKGYNKLPYCNAHYPKTSHTAVADTPEMNRLQKLTKDQSTVLYHEQFEKEKGKFTVVNDTPENLRLKQTQEKISQVKYHQEFERMKGMKTSVTDDPETERHRYNTHNVSNVEYQGLKDKRQFQEQRRDLVGIGQPNIMRQPPGSIGDYGAPPPQEAPSPYSARGQHGSTTSYSSQGKVEQPRGPRSVGSIANYDPINNQYGSIAADEWVETVPAPQPHRAEPPSHHPVPSSPPPPMEGSNGVPQGKVPLVPLGQPLALMVHSPHEDQPHYPAGPPPGPPEPVPQGPPGGANKPMQGEIYKAMYDYEAADSDEVSFREEDLIVDPEPIDAGWMYGRVKRTGQVGMLPANYVERVQ